MDQQMIEYYHRRGLMPDWAYYQQNGKSAIENYREQTQMIKARYDEQKRIEEAKKKLEEEMFVAMMSALEESIDPLEQTVAQNIGNMMSAVFEGGAIHPERLKNQSFSVALGAALGKALAQASFKLLDDILNGKDDNRSRR